MSELRIPTNALQAEVLCADGRIFKGRVFLPVLSSMRSGGMRPAEWMNDVQPFFAFLPDDGAGSFILNRQEVLVLSFAAAADGDDDAVIDETVPHRHVIVECRDHRFEGDVVIDMPAHLRRLTDYLNRPDPFLIVRDGERHHLIRKARITRVIEPKGA